jgi:hypothetical protein
MGIRDKLPLLNSDKKGVRVAGYIMYAFIALVVLDAILPAPDVEVGASTTAGVKYTDSDLDWLNWTTTQLLLIDDDLNRVSRSIEAGNPTVAMYAFEDLFKHAKVSQNLSSSMTVSKPLSAAKKEWESALENYAQAGSYGYTGSRDLNTKDMDRASSYLDKADDHLVKMKPLLDKGKADLGIS